MQLFQLLRVVDPELLPERCKVHLASWNGVEDPLDVYLAEVFDEWQAWQSKKNFERPFIVSLIALAQDNLWLFAGAHDSHDCEWVEAKGMFRYRTAPRPATDELNGRLTVGFQRPGRQSYLLADNYPESFHVVELRPEKMRVQEFRGYAHAMLTKQRLDIVVEQRIESWRAPLASVSGVYVIADRKTGKLYVGSATGEDRIWGRWCAYSLTGHGGNRELVDLLKREGATYAENFQFGVLETADTHASREDILARESYWKDMLVTRVPYGYNAN